MDVGDWLRSLNLGRYEATFRENEVDRKVLPTLTAEDLKDLGVTTVGHRRTLLDAITALRVGTNASAKELAPTTGNSIRDIAERRQVTVMFSDLVGSTALAANWDPEDLGEILSAYRSCVSAVVSRFDGFLAQYLGDGVLVYFGYPEAHEDDAERAVRAGLELIAAVAELKTRVTLQARVGIGTGLVVVGDIVGSGGEHAVGETPNLSARLQALAEPSTIVIAENTRKLVGDLFELKDLGLRNLKGLPQPLQIWQVLGTGAAESRFEALRASNLTPFVGRRHEIATLLAM
jgi:class 3 adenylate cyclase